MGVIAKGISRGCQGLFTPVSLGYPLSVFNKNSTLKEISGQFEYNTKNSNPHAFDLQRHSIEGARLLV